MELVKTQMQVRPECTKVSDTVKSIVERAGYKGLLRGLGTTIVREVPAVGIYSGSWWFVHVACCPWQLHSLIT